MINVITDKQQIQEFQRQFQEKLDFYFSEKIDCVVGYQGESHPYPVNYSPDFDIWIYSKKLENRFWNAFGVGKPKKGQNVSIVGEINFPYQEINRRIAGVYAKEDNGQILVLHRGRIGGGRKGIGKTFFTDNFRGDFVTVLDGDLVTEFCIVGELNSKHFPKQVSNFIKEIYRVKNLEEGQTTSNFNDLADFNYSDEQFGKSITERNEPIVIERTHGIVVNALARQLEIRRLKIGNDRNRDLFIHKNGQINTLFEVKTSSATQCLYAAVGQLLLYSIPINNYVKLIAVLPDKLSKFVTMRFSSIGIKILYYEWNNEKINFIDLDNILQ